MNNWMHAQLFYRPLRDQRSKEVAKLPFPVMGTDGHYLSFNYVYRTETVDVSQHIDIKILLSF
jgi:hypothetical protein